MPPPHESHHLPAEVISRTEEVRGSNPLTSTPKRCRSERRRLRAGGSHRIPGPRWGRERPWEGLRRRLGSGYRSWSTIRATLRLTGSTTCTSGGSWSLLGVQLQSPVGALAERLAQLLAGEEPKLGGGRVAQPEGTRPCRAVVLGDTAPGKGVGQGSREPRGVAVDAEVTACPGLLGGHLGRPR